MCLLSISENSLLVLNVCLGDVEAPVLDCASDFDVKESCIRGNQSSVGPLSSFKRQKLFGNPAQKP